MRRGAGARPLWRVAALAVALDAAPVLLGFAAVFGATARPLFAGLVIGALAGGLSLADRVKRIVLDEPVVFADRAELLEVVRHPSLYLPFAGSAWVLAGAAAAIALVAMGLAWAEPPLWSRSILGASVDAVLCAGLAYGCFAVPSSWPALLQRLAAFYTRRLTVSRDAAQDAAALGPLACLAIHATTAAAERPARRQTAAATAAMLKPFPTGAGPVVLVQAESFFDPARLHPELAGSLPHIDALAASAVQRGCLDVPAWGANTVRTEFAVLTGVTEEVLGLDRFNPYEAFAQTGDPLLPSLIRMARESGYRTVFVHPFDLRFYARSNVMPLLGFDELVGPEAFVAAKRRGDWVSDEAVGEVVATVLRRHGPHVFVFAATMEAHGPWGEPKPGEAVPLPAALRTVPEAGQLAQWLWHLQGTDRMIGFLARTVADIATGAGTGWLALYGDHQPSLPTTFAATGLADHRSDYVIWSNVPAIDDCRVVTLPATDLGHALVSCMRSAMGVP